MKGAKRGVEECKRVDAREERTVRRERRIEEIVTVNNAGVEEGGLCFAYFPLGDFRRFP